MLHSDLERERERDIYLIISYILSSGSLPSGGPGVVVHIVGSASGVLSLFPASREGFRSAPCCGPIVVVHVVSPAVTVKLQLPALR